MNRTASVLALAVLVSLSLACGWLGRLKGNANNGAVNNRADNSNSNNSNGNNSNGPGNSNQATVPSAFLTRFAVSREQSGKKEATTFATDEQLYLVFEVKEMPDAKGLKGRLVADVVRGVPPGSSLDSVKLTHKGESLATFMYFAPPRTLWHPGEYHVELVLLNTDGTESVLRSQAVSIHLVME
jgi:hypothetical protein